MAPKTLKTTYVLAECLDMTALSALHQALLEQAKAKAMVVDGSEVQRFSTAAVQLLLCCARTMEQANASFHIKNPSDVIVRVFEQLGLTEELQKRLMV